MNYSIYALADPFDFNIKYIGHTQNPLLRYDAHFNDNSLSKKGKWITSLKANNEIPIYLKLDSAHTKETACNKEAKWVNHFVATGQVLLNNCIHVSKIILPQRKYPKKMVLELAAQWEKDARTIARWLKENNPMITHPESLKIIERYSTQK